MILTDKLFPDLAAAAEDFDIRLKRGEQIHFPQVITLTDGTLWRVTRPGIIMFGYLGRVASMKIQ